MYFGEIKIDPRLIGYGWNAVMHFCIDLTIDYWDAGQGNLYKANWRRQPQGYTQFRLTCAWLSHPVLTFKGTH